MLDFDDARRRALDHPAVRPLLDDPPPWELATWGWASDAFVWVYAGPPGWVAGEDDFLDPVLVKVDQVGNAELTTYMAQADALEFAIQVGTPPARVDPDSLL